jgi:hypothetical protein
LVAKQAIIFQILTSFQMLFARSISLWIEETFDNNCEIQRLLVEELPVG